MRSGLTLYLPELTPLNLQCQRARLRPVCQINGPLPLVAQIDVWTSNTITYLFLIYVGRNGMSVRSVPFAEDPAAVFSVSFRENRDSLWKIRIPSCAISDTGKLLIRGNLQSGERAASSGFACVHHVRRRPGAYRHHGGKRTILSNIRNNCALTLRYPNRSARCH